MDITYGDMAVVPVIMFVLWIMTGLGLERRFAPAAALVLGLGYGFATSFVDPIQAFLIGSTLGAAAVGFNSADKHLRRDE